MNQSYTCAIDLSFATGRVFGERTSYPFEITCQQAQVWVGNTITVFLA